MSGLVQAFADMQAQGILTAAFILGFGTFVIAIVGKLPIGEGHDIPVWSRVVLGVVGVVFALIGVVGVLMVQETQTEAIAEAESIANSTSTPPPVMTATSQPVVVATQVTAPTQQVLIVTATPLPASPTSVPTNTLQAVAANVSGNVVSKSYLDGLFGADNWFCYGDRYHAAIQRNSPHENDGIGVKILNSDIIVQTPIRQVNSWNGSSSTDDVARGGVGAGIEFQSGYYMPPNDCPSWQIPALQQWIQSRNNSNWTGSFSATQITSFVGHSNWVCKMNMNYAIDTSFSVTRRVEYPATFASDNNQQINYAIGEDIQPSTNVTVWLNGLCQ